MHHTAGIAGITSIVSIVITISRRLCRQPVQPASSSARVRNTSPAQPARPKWPKLSRRRRNPRQPEDSIIGDQERLGGPAGRVPSPAAPVTKAGPRPAQVRMSPPLDTRQRCAALLFGARLGEVRGQPSWLSWSRA